MHPLAQQHAPGEPWHGLGAEAERDIEPVVAAAIWEDAEWPSGDDLVTLATTAVATRAADHMRVVPLVPELRMPIEVVWREDDDSPVLARFLELATPPPEGVP